MGFDVFWTTHLLIKVKLGHESIVGTGDRARLPKCVERGGCCVRWVETVEAEEVGEDDGDGTGDTH